MGWGLFFFILGIDIDIRVAALACNVVDFGNTVLRVSGITHVEGGAGRRRFFRSGAGHTTAPDDAHVMVGEYPRFTR